MATLVNKMNRDVKVIIPNMREFRVFYSDNEGSTMFFKRDWEEEKTTKQEEQVWSEEDEKMLASFLHKVEVCDLLTNKENAWIVEKLKSFRSQSKVEWSEEDKRNFYWISTHIQERNMTLEYTRQVHKILSWLESLRPSWKPSEEQMKAFKKYIEEFQARAEAAVGGWNNFDVMIQLYEQLKKL